MAEARLEERIELRRQGVEDLQDEGCFDLAWFPHSFMPEEAVPRGLRSVWRALRPGGWLWTGAVDMSGPELWACVARLRNALWGGAVRRTEEICALLAAAGIADIHIVPMPAEFGATIEGRAGGAALVGRRPLDSVAAP